MKKYSKTSRKSKDRKIKYLRILLLVSVCIMTLSFLSIFAYADYYDENGVYIVGDPPGSDINDIIIMSIDHTEAMKRIMMVLAMCKIAQRLSFYLMQLGIGAPHTGRSILSDVVAASKTFSHMANSLRGVASRVGSGGVLGHGGMQSTPKPMSASEFKQKQAEQAERAASGLAKNRRDKRDWQTGQAAQIRQAKQQQATKRREAEKAALKIQHGKNAYFEKSQAKAIAMQNAAAGKASGKSGGGGGTLSKVGAGGAPVKVVGVGGASRKSAATSTVVAKNAATYAGKTAVTARGKTVSAVTQAGTIGGRTISTVQPSGQSKTPVAFKRGAVKDASGKTVVDASGKPVKSNVYASENAPFAKTIGTPYHQKQVNQMFAAGAAANAKAADAQAARFSHAVKPISSDMQTKLTENAKAITREEKMKSFKESGLGIEENGKAVFMTKNGNIGVTAAARAGGLYAVSDKNAEGKAIAGTTRLKDSVNGAAVSETMAAAAQNWANLDKSGQQILAESRGQTIPGGGAVVGGGGAAGAAPGAIQQTMLNTVGAASVKEAREALFNENFDINSNAMSIAMANKVYGGMFADKQVGTGFTSVKSVDFDDRIDENGSYITGGRAIQVQYIDAEGKEQTRMIYGQVAATAMSPGALSHMSSFISADGALSVHDGPAATVIAQQERDRAEVVQEVQDYLLKQVRPAYGTVSKEEEKALKTVEWYETSQRVNYAPPETAYKFQESEIQVTATTQRLDQSTVEYHKEISNDMRQLYEHGYEKLPAEVIQEVKQLKGSEMLSANKCENNFKLYGAGFEKHGTFVTEIQKKDGTTFITATYDAKAAGLQLCTDIQRDENGKAVKDDKGNVIRVNPHMEGIVGSAEIIEYLSGSASRFGQYTAQVKDEKTGEVKTADAVSAEVFTNTLKTAHKEDQFDALFNQNHKIDDNAGTRMMAENALKEIIPGLESITKIEGVDNMQIIDVAATEFLRARLSAEGKEEEAQQAVVVDGEVNGRTLKIDYVDTAGAERTVEVYNAVSASSIDNIDTPYQTLKSYEYENNETGGGYTVYVAKDATQVQPSTQVPFEEVRKDAERAQAESASAEQIESIFGLRYDRSSEPVTEQQLERADSFVKFSTDFDDYVNPFIYKYAAVIDKASVYDESKRGEYRDGETFNMFNAAFIDSAFGGDVDRIVPGGDLYVPGSQLQQALAEYMYERPQANDWNRIDAFAKSYEKTGENLLSEFKQIQPPEQQQKEPDTGNLMMFLFRKAAPEGKTEEEVKKAAEATWKSKYGIEEVKEIENSISPYDTERLGQVFEYFKSSWEDIQRAEEEREPDQADDRLRINGVPLDLKAELDLQIFLSGSVVSEKRSDIDIYQQVVEERIRYHEIEQAAPQEKFEALFEVRKELLSYQEDERKQADPYAKFEANVEEPTRYDPETPLGKLQDSTLEEIAKYCQEILEKPLQEPPGYEGKLHDTAFQRMVIDLDINQKPEVLTEEDFNKRVEEEGLIRIFRNAKDDSIDNFMYGDVYKTGSGFAGNGTYAFVGGTDKETSRNDEASQIAEDFKSPFAGRYEETYRTDYSEPERGIMYMAFKKDAKIVSRETLDDIIDHLDYNTRQALFAHGSELENSGHYGYQDDLISNISKNTNVNRGYATLALLLGYDAVSNVDTGYGSECVILRRDSVVLSNQIRRPKKILGIRY